MKKLNYKRIGILLLKVSGLGLLGPGAYKVYEWVAPLIQTVEQVIPVVAP